MSETSQPRREEGYYWVLPFWSPEHPTIAYIYGRDCADVIGYGEADQTSLLIIEKVSSPTTRPTREQVQAFLDQG